MEINTYRPAPTDTPQANGPQANGPQADDPQADDPQADDPQADDPQANGPQADGPPELPLERLEAVICEWSANLTAAEHDWLRPSPSSIAGAVGSDGSAHRAPTG